jgi:Niemann-Pick C1 protein
LPDLPLGARPSPRDVARLLPWFLASRPSEACAKGGAGVYTGAVRMDSDDPTGVAGLGESGAVRASALRTYHTPLAEQRDFISALRAARALAESASRDLGLDVYVYSVFHVFFEQYLDLASQAFRLLALPLAAVVGACGLFTASWPAALLLLACLCSTLVHLAGAMSLAGMQVNAVSLVNLAMALGIAVEFHAHVLHAYLASPPGWRRARRVEAALRRAGAPVASGITLTKLAGVGVLAFSRTRIFEVYYFRLYLALVVVGAWHGLVLLPMLLARVGPTAAAPLATVAAGGGDSAADAGGGGGGNGRHARRRPQEVDLGAGAGAAAVAGGEEAEPSPAPAPAPAAPAADT